MTAIHVSDEQADGAPVLKGGRIEDRPRLGFKLQLVLFVGTLVVLMIVLQGYYLNQRYAQALEDQIGHRALAVAKTLAQSPELKAGFGLDEPSVLIQPLAESVRKATGASFVVVGNQDSIRYSHPLPDRIGERMVGEDNDAALIRGESYVSRAVGSLGPSIRGKVPVVNEAGDVLGVVSVGFLAEEIEQRVSEDLAAHRAWMVLIALLGVCGAFWIASRFKRVILGLEPHEIARRLNEKNAILESIHEGIVAVNKQGNITLLNNAARKLMPEEALTDPPLGRPVLDVLPKSQLTEVLETAESQFDRETWIGGQLVVVNRVPIEVDGRLEGAVATFRSRMEILELSRRLFEASRLAEELRVQAHEFSNKLHTIAGLLHLGRVPEALDLIGQETRMQQVQIAVLQNRVADPMLCGMLAGKIIRAHARGVDIDIDRDSSLQTALSEKGRDALVSIVGNLVENACEAPRDEGTLPVVRVFFTDMGDDLVFEVDDNGHGVPVNLTDAVFQTGVSTKGAYRGIGLSLARELCRRHGGDVALENSELGGACFVAVVSKRLVGQEVSHD